MAGQPTSGWDAEYQAALQAQLNRDRDFRENTIGVLPVGATPMGLDEIRAAWPAQADKYGTFFTKNPGQSPVVRSGGSEKGFHPRAIEQFTDPKTGQKYERRTFYTVPSGTQLTDTPEYPLALAQRSFDPFSEKTVQELSAIPGVMDWVGRLRWSGDRSFSDLSPDEKQQAIYQTAQMMRDNYYASHFPNHTIAGNWMPVGEPTKKPQTEYMPGGWWEARGNSIAGAFQNGLSGLNSILPFELVPGMDGRKHISEAMETFQHMNTRLPSHESTRKATDRLIRLSSPQHVDPKPEMRWAPVMPAQREELPPTEIQMVAENKVRDWLKMQRASGGVFKALDGTEKTFDQLTPDDQSGVVHEMLRTYMAAEIDRKAAEVRAWEGLQAENARPVKGAGLMLDAVNAGAGFLPTAAAMYITGGLGSAALPAAASESVIGTGLASVASTVPFSAGAYQRHGATPYSTVEGLSEHPTGMSNLHALQAINSGNGQNYDQLVIDSKLRGAGSALGTAIAAPIVGSATNKIVGAVLPRAQGIVSDVVRRSDIPRIPPFKINVVGSMPNNPTFLVNSPLLGFANGATKFAVNTAANAATMPIFPVAERAGESLFSWDHRPITDLPALGHEMVDYAGLGAMFGPYNYFIHGKLNEAAFAQKNPGAIGAFQADPRWFPNYNDGFFTENPRWTRDPRFLFKDANGNPIDPWVTAYPNSRQNIRPESQMFGPETTEAARQAYYQWLEEWFKKAAAAHQPPTPPPQPKPAAPGLGG
jgi:hypothetical protein